MQIITNISLIFICTAIPSIARIICEVELEDPSKTKRIAMYGDLHCPGSSETPAMLAAIYQIAQATKIHTHKNPFMSCILEGSLIQSLTEQKDLYDQGEFFGPVDTCSMVAITTYAYHMLSKTCSMTDANEHRTNFLKEQVLADVQKNLTIQLEELATHAYQNNQKADLVYLGAFEQAVDALIASWQVKIGRCAGIQKDPQLKQSIDDYFTSTRTVCLQLGKNIREYLENPASPKDDVLSFLRKLYYKDNISESSIPLAILLNEPFIILHTMLPPAITELQGSQILLALLATYLDLVVDQLATRLCDYTIIDAIYSDTTGKIFVLAGGAHTTYCKRLLLKHGWSITATSQKIYSDTADQHWKSTAWMYTQFNKISCQAYSLNDLTTIYGYLGHEELPFGTILPNALLNLCNLSPAQNAQLRMRTPFAQTVILSDEELIKRNLNAKWNPQFDLEKQIKEEKREQQSRKQQLGQETRIRRERKEQELMRFSTRAADTQALLKQKFQQLRQNNSEWLEALGASTVLVFGYWALIYAGLNHRSIVV